MIEMIRNKIPPLVSVIVPVYNTEDYLIQCLDSLKGQLLSNIEIILIDDGSTDGSGYICDRYVEEDPSFKVIHKTNEGLSAARNDGLRIAVADYIMFVDSDDWVDSSFCKSPFFVAIENNAELVAFLYTKHGKRFSRRQASFPKEGLTSKQEMLTSLWQITEGFAWNKLYHRKLFDQEELRYPKGYLCEDLAVTHRIIHNANNIYVLNEFLYHYRSCRPGSITNNRSAKLLHDSLQFHFKRIEDLKQWGYEYETELERVALLYLVIMGRDNKLSYKCDAIIRESNSFSDTTISLKWRLMFRLYRFWPKLFDFVSISMGKRCTKFIPLT